MSLYTETDDELTDWKARAEKAEAELHKRDHVHHSLDALEIVQIDRDHWKKEAMAALEDKAYWKRRTSEATTFREMVEAETVAKIVMRINKSVGIHQRATGFHRKYADETDDPKHANNEALTKYATDVLANLAKMIEQGEWRKEKGE